MDPEKVCATAVTADCFNSLVHLRSTSRCMLFSYLKSPDDAAYGNKDMS